MWLCMGGPTDFVTMLAANLVRLDLQLVVIERNKVYLLPTCTIHQHLNLSCLIPSIKPPIGGSQSSFAHPGSITYTKRAQTQVLTCRHRVESISADTPQ